MLCIDSCVRPRKISQRDIKGISLFESSFFSPARTFLFSTAKWIALKVVSSRAQWVLTWTKLETLPSELGKISMAAPWQQGSSRQMQNISISVALLFLLIMSYQTSQLWCSGEKRDLVLFKFSLLSFQQRRYLLIPWMLWVCIEELFSIVMIIFYANAGVKVNEFLQTDKNRLFHHS